MRPAVVCPCALEGTRIERTAALFRSSLALALLVALARTALTGGGARAHEAAPGATPASANLGAVKQYVADEAAQQKTATAYLVQIAQRYDDLAQAVGFDYATLWQSSAPEVAGLLAAAKQGWVDGHAAYEMNEGLIAGIPSFSYYDAWIDASPTGAEDATNALDWTLTLPDGTTMAKPGNLFHSLAEPMLWGTDPDVVGLAIDIDGDGTQELGEVLPDANLMLGVFTALDDATGQMQAAVDAWEPTIEDAFTALVTMLPTMNEYFEQWNLSAFVAGTATAEQAYVGNSRLVDVYGIVHGLQFTYQQISPAVQAVDPALHAQIDAGCNGLATFVTDLYAKESNGTVFTAEEADLFGSEAQAKATTLVGQVSQAIALLGLQV